jgi:hypothetical protein
MYKLYKIFDGEWWIHGNYDDAHTLAMAAFQIGLDGFEQIKVVQE